jgi:DNA-binding PadR family transcriptional regulator
MRQHGRPHSPLTGNVALPNMTLHWLVFFDTRQKGVTMSLPELTHLQFLILAILLDGELAGRALRERLAEEGIAKNGPAFYQLMARLEDGKWVEGWYDQKVTEGQVARERRYKVTASGAAACEQAWEFYLSRSKRGLEGGLAHA